MLFCPICSEKRYKNANFCHNCSFNFGNAIKEAVKKNQDNNEIEVLKKLKDITLEDIKKYIDLTEWRGGLKLILNLLIKRNVKNLSDFFDGKLLRRLLPALISDEEIETLALADIKKIVENEDYPKEVLEEMKKQHFRTWQMILEGSLFILECETNVTYPRIWYKKIDSCAEDTEKINYIDIDNSLTIKHEGLGLEYYYLLIKPKYSELLVLIKDHLLVLPKDSKVEKTFIGKIKSLCQSKIQST